MMKNNESGRSMIEMLGVLAIIGVLSVGGIAGYSKAMMKYRINKSLGATGTTTNGGNTGLIAKARLFPDELLNGTNNVIANSNPFGGSFELVAASRSSTTDADATKCKDCGDAKAFMLSLDSIPEEACMDLITQDWGSASGSGLIVAGVVKTNSGSSPDFDADIYKSYLQGCTSSAADDGYVCGAQGPMTAAEAASVCEGDYNRLYLKFY